MTTGEYEADQTVEISDASHLLVKPVVSVLMLVYNHGPYIAEAIESVLGQKCDFSFELLIGDDCSTDNSRDIALRYQKAHPSVIRFISSACNVGMQCNHRRLVDASRGELVAYCEGDDYWIDPAKLQLQVDYLCAHPEAGAVHSDFDHILFRAGRWRALPHYQRRMRGSVPKGEIFSSLLAGNFIQTCTLCVRTDLCRQYLASDPAVDSYPVGDWPLCLSVAALHKIEYLDRSLAVYRKVSGSAMNSGHASSLKLVLGCQAMIDDVCRRFSIDDALRAVAHSELHKTTLSLAFLAGDASAFDMSWIWLERNDPAVVQPWRRKFLRWLLLRHTARRAMVRIIEASRTAKEVLSHWGSL
jgi:glycosyltransferase involved in cell wall biosynthesis